MLFAFILLDKPASEQMRMSIRPEHKAYLGLVSDRLAFAGPLTHDDGVSMVGSLLVIEFSSRAEAHAWLSNEPFMRAGLYASTTVHAFVNLWPQMTGFPPALP